jgi:hypothetical protein
VNRSTCETVGPSEVPQKVVAAFSYSTGSAVTIEVTDDGLENNDIDGEVR